MSFGLIAEYLGWKPAAGVYGRQFCDPVVQDLVDKRRRFRLRLRRHSLEFVGKKKLKIADLPDSGGGGGSGGGRGHHGKPLRYPSIPVSDITYVQQEDGRTDPLVFCLILLGFNEESSHSVHVHAWRGGSLEAVSEFVARLNKCLTSREHLQLVRQRERELLQSREVEPSGLFAAPEPRLPQLVSCPAGHLHTVAPASCAPSSSSSAMASAAVAALPPELRSVTEELKRKLRVFGDRASPPLLHPPRDYDSSGAPGNHSNSASASSSGRSRANDGQCHVRSNVPARPTSDLMVRSVGRESTNVDSDSGEDEAEELEAVAARITGSINPAEAWADPGMGFSTWRRRRLQQRAAAAAVSFQPPPPPAKPGQSMAAAASAAGRRI